MNTLFFKRLLIILAVIIAIGIISGTCYSQRIENPCRSIWPQTIIDRAISTDKTDTASGIGIFFDCRSDASEKDYVSTSLERFNAPPNKDKSKGLGFLIIGIVFIVACIIMLIEYFVMKRSNIGYLIGIIVFMIIGVALSIVGIVYLV